jgi:Fe-S-cluster-containing hydrogenase component 2
LREFKIIYNADACSACGACEIMCSLWHEGIAGPASARLNIIREPFTHKHHQIICPQCHNPPCYAACPGKDRALCIDGVTGAVYINENECDGCGLCIDACPFDLPRIKLNAVKKVAIKCDLCRGREDGPICVEYCPFQALTLQPDKKR